MIALQAHTERTASLGATDVAALFDLYAAYYDACSYERFRADLAEKDYVIRLHEPGGALRGFTTLRVMDFEFQDRAGRAIYSGDTIVDHRYRGGQILPLAWCRLAGQLKAQAPERALYWFLIVKGHRTYRYLPAFARRFYPTWRRETPAGMKALMDHLARSKFGAAYRTQSGVVRFECSRGHLREEWASIDPHVREKRDVKFFLERNPGHCRGDELVCLTELHPDNLRSHALRAFREAMRA